MSTGCPHRVEVLGIKLRAALVKLGTAISQEKVPYVMTILFVALGWVIIHAVERADNSPTMIYETESIHCDEGKTQFTINITNATRTIQFENIVFKVVVGQPGATIVKAYKYAISPAWEGDDPVNPERNTATFQIKSLQPNAKIVLVTQYVGPGPAYFSLSQTGSPVRLVKSSVETFFAAHEISLMLVALTCYALFILLVITNGP